MRLFTRSSFALLIATVIAAPLAAQTKPQHEIYAIRYATLKDFAVSGLVAGAGKSREMDIAMMVIPMKGGVRGWPP